jgi:uncharacterized protein YndB with AHSA1/START domain
MQLKFSRKRKIEAAPSIVWMVISDPRQWPAFLDRIQELNETNGILKGRIRWKERDFHFTGRVTEAVPDKLLRAEFDVTQGDRTDQMTVCFTIRPCRGGSRVGEEVVMDLPVNPLLGLLVRLISRFGRAREPGNLDRLAELVEC